MTELSVLARMPVRGLQAKERRRRHAVALLEHGWTQAQVARQFGVSREAVRKWFVRYMQGGYAGLTARPAKGAPPKVSAAQLAPLGEMLARGARAWGYDGDEWTPTRVAQVVERELGVRYRPTYMRRLLRRLGLAWPGEQALQPAAA